MDKLINTRGNKKQENCSHRLFCFPWAGGGTGLYMSWAKFIPGHIEVNALRLPGRESRFKDPPYTGLDVLVEDVCKTLLPIFKEKPFAFFGHSLGAIICFELACYLKRHHDLEPTHLFLSGATSPYSSLRQEKFSDKPLKELTDDEAIARLTKMGGTPPEVLAQKGLMKLLIPIIANDLTMLQDYSPIAPSQPFLTCPVNFFDGKDDKTRDHDIPNWKTITSGAFDVQMLPGGHFFLQDEANAGKIIRCVASKLRP